jgi:hypothetical protein
VFASKDADIDPLDYDDYEFDNGQEEEKESE